MTVLTVLGIKSIIHTPPEGRIIPKQLNTVVKSLLLKLKVDT